MGGSYQRHADLGEVAAELIDASAPSGPPLQLEDVAKAFDAIAAARGVAPKREVLRDLLARATADEARYLVKIVSGETRIGLREGLLEDAIARAFGPDREAVGRAPMPPADTGQTALRARPDPLAGGPPAHLLP